MKCQIIFCSNFMEWHDWTMKRPVLHLQNLQILEVWESISDPNSKRTPPRFKKRISHLFVLPYLTCAFNDIIKYDRVGECNVHVYSSHASARVQSMFEPYIASSTCTTGKKMGVLPYIFNIFQRYRRNS